MKRNLFIFLVIIILVAAGITIHNYRNTGNVSVVINDYNNESEGVINLNNLDSPESFYKEVKQSVISKLDSMGIETSQLDLCNKECSTIDDTKCLIIYLDEYIVNVMYYSDRNTIDIVVE